MNSGVVAGGSIPEGVRSHALRRVNWLESQYLPRGSRSQPTSAGAAAMAQLRRSDPADITQDPSLWGLTMEDLPEALVGKGDEPSRAERAIHGAIVLYAIHQQSRGESVHRRGISLGEAARQLDSRTANGSLSGAAIRRFQTVARASIWTQRMYHLRSFVTLLRAHGIPLDYGRLSRDLYLLQDPRRGALVRLEWGRDLHRRPSTESAVPPANA